MKKIRIVMTALLLMVSLSARAEHDLAGQFKKGFTFTTDDGASSISLHTRLQPRYAFGNADDGSDDVHSFFVRRAYLGVTGSLFAPELTYDLTLTATASGGTNLYYGYVAYEFQDVFQVLGGLHKVRFNRQEITSDGKQQFVDRSLANERFNLDRSVGLVFFGETDDKTFTYDLSVFNGRDTKNAVNANLDLGYSLRLVWNAIGDYGYEEGDLKNRDDCALTFGLAGTYYQEKAGVSATEDNVLMGNFDVGFKKKGFSFQGEAFLRNTSPDGTSSSANDLGYYAQAGYFFVPETFEAALRVSSLFDDIGDDALPVYFENGSLSSLGAPHDGVDAVGDAEDEHEFSLALNYYLFEQNFKIQGQYTYMMDGQAGDDIAQHIAMLQATLQF